MFGSKPRSGIPVAGGKSGIPVVRKSTGQSTTAARTTRNSAKSGIPSPGSSGDRSPAARQKLGSSTLQGVKKKGGPPSDPTDDPKILKREVENLCKEILEKDIALQELTDKFAEKSEECADLLDERDTLKRKNSVDLQHVTKDYDELQEKLKHQQTYITDMETSHDQDKESLKLELEILKGEHEMELAMLKKEMQDLRAKAERKKTTLDVEDDAASDTSSRGMYPGMEAMQEQMSSLQANYEEEIQTVKDELQMQMQKTNDAIERNEQQEFELHEQLNQLKGRFNQEQEVSIEKHRSEIAELRSTYEERFKLQEQRHQSKVTDLNSPRDVDVTALKEEQEAYIEALKEQYQAEIDQLKVDLKDKDDEIALNKNQMADDFVVMQNEYETQINELQSALQEAKRASEELTNKNAMIEELKSELDKYKSDALAAIEDMRVLQKKGIEDLKAADYKGRESGDESFASKSSLESELHQKDQLQAYEHEIRNLQSELKKERQEYNATKESLENAITDLEGRMKEREEQVRSELREEHQYEVETLEEEHKDALHEKDKSHRHEITKLKQEYTEKLAVAEALGKTEGDLGSKIEVALNKQKEEHINEIEALKLEHGNEIENLNETLENLQSENEELQTEFDLVVGDLELENTKMKARGDKRRGSGVLKEQISRLKGSNEEHVAHLIEVVETYKANVEILEKENKELKSEGKQTDPGDDYLNKISELEKLVHTLEAGTGRSSSDELAEYKAECDILQDEVSQYKRLGDEDRRRVEEYKEMASTLQDKLDKLAQDKLKESEGHGKKISDLVEQLRDIKEEQEKEREEWKSKTDGLESEMSGMQNEEYKKMVSKLQDELDRLAQDKLTESEEHGKKIADLLEQLRSIKEEQEKEREEWKIKTDLLESEMAGMQKEKDDAMELQKSNYESTITELRSEMDKIEAENKRIKKENQKLHVDAEEAWSNQKIESEVVAEESFVISEEDTDMIVRRDSIPGRKEDLQHDQHMKGVVEELENKASNLETRLEQATLQLASKDKRMESVNAEMNVLRENLENERTVVQNLEDRIQGLVHKHDAEVKVLRQKSEDKEERVSQMISEGEYLKNVNKLRQDLESSLAVNSKQADNIEGLDGKVSSLEQQLEREQDSLAEHARKNHELEVKNTNLEKLVALKEEELSRFEQEQIQHEANSVADNLQKSTASEEKITRLEENLRMKTEELAKFEQQQIAFEANSVAEELKLKEENESRMDEIEKELISKKREVQDLMDKLKLERSEHAQKVVEFDYMVEQLKEDASNGDRIQELVSEIQKYKEEITALNSTLENERSESADKIKEFEKEKRRAEAEIKSLTEMVEKERNGNDKKREQLEEEVEKRRTEIKALSSILETEQTSHEKTIKDTQKHFARMDRIEQENIEIKKECSQLQSKLREVKEELSQQREKNSELLSRSQKMTIDDLEEVHKLNRSLTEAEIDKGKLLGEVECTKQELQRTQEKYNKMKEKFTSTKQKWREDHHKLEGMLMSPRGHDMGLQTSIIDTKVLDDTNQRLSVAVSENSKLEGELKGSKEDAQRRNNDMRALRRANDVLIKQNQTLYLETESLKMKITELSEKSDQLREVSIHLTEENKKCDAENKDLKERLNRMEDELQRAKGERSSVDALNESSKSELDELTSVSNKHKDENEKLKDQNDFLLSQGKRLQLRVDELESQVKELKTTLFLKDLSDKSKRDVPVSEIITITSSEAALESAPVGPGGEVQRFVEENRVMQQNLERMQGLLNSKDLELQQSQSEKRALIDGFTKEKSDLTASQLPTLKSSPVGSSSPNGDKGYVGIKSYQVIEWDRQPKNADSPTHVTTPTNTVPRDPLEGLQVAKAKELDFDSSAYLGSAYWEAMSFLKTMSPDN